MKSIALFCIILFSLLTNNNGVKAQSLILNLGQSSATLANNIIGPGITLSNYSGNFSTYSRGSFTNGNSTSLGINSGIILSTGNLNVPLTPANAIMSSTLGMPGDPLLDQIASPTFDAQSLSFDFSAPSDSIEFSFVFTSEEYNDYVNSTSNDVLAFFITGPGYTNNTNIAMIPNTNTPISINTINNGGPYQGASAGPCMNCNYYIDNLDTTSGSNPVSISFDGLTTVIKLKFKVMPCSIYNFRVAIADVTDDLYDSAILIEEGSFKIVAPLSITVNGIATDTAYICQGGSVTLTMPDAVSHGWSTGDTSLSITVSQPGIYEGIISDLSGCFAFVQIHVVNQPGTIQTPVITQAGSTINSNIVPSPGITFQWFLDGVLIPGATNENVPVQGNGCYNLVIYEGTCEAASNIICITNTFIQEINTTGFTVFPHPVSNTSILKTPFKNASETSMMLYDVTGKNVFSKSYPGGEDIIIESKIVETGIYFVELRNNSSSNILKGKIVFVNE